MPYKDPRVQLNLKLTPTEYAALEQEAEVADTNVAQYARHLVVERAAQPLSKGAYAERQESRRREAAWVQQRDALQEQIRTLEAARADLAKCQQRVHVLEIELRQAQDPDRINGFIQRALDEREATEVAKRAAEKQTSAATESAETAETADVRRARRRARRTDL